MNHRSLMAIVPLVCLLLVLAVAVPAYAEATVTKASFPFAISFPETNPCTGEPVSIDIIGEARLHTVEDASGHFHRTFMLRADLVETNNTTGAASQGTIEWNRSFEAEQQTFVINGRIIHPGPGNNVVIHLLVHVSPNGVALDRASTECH